jgi:UDP-N-acetylmuramate dehydrogenase
MKSTTKTADLDVNFPYLLPNVRGRYAFNYDLSKATWFKVGGKAEVLFKPKDVDDLALFLREIDGKMPIVILGAGSNVLVRDGGIKGCVIKLGSGFSDIQFDGTFVTVGAACLDRTFVMECAQKGLSGLEFLVGVPGSIGGAVAMNAGAYGGEIVDFLVWVEIIDAHGNVSRLQTSDLHMTYRHGNLPDNAIVTRACFELAPKDPALISETIDAFLQKREDTQPIRGRTGGSTFKNPASEGMGKDSAPKKAWELIDDAGCRGMSINDAQVSEKHCNFLLNLHAAKAADLEHLGETVRATVKAKTGITLEWEIIRLGDKEDF